jgi:spore coat polysaccharide biosynthesis protein SpsF
MGSTRLPGKVLMDLGGASVLERVVRRLERAKRIQEVVIATTVSPADDFIVRACDSIGVASFRGSENDVLDRYVQAASQHHATAVIRVTSDCPLIDPALVDEVIELFLAEQVDLACNTLPRTYPRGLDAEIFSMETLQRAEEFSDQPHHREHVTPIFYERRDLFRVASTRSREDFSHHRWTLDTPEDLKLIRAIYEEFANRDDFSWREVIALMQRNPDLARINAHIQQKPVREPVAVS